MNVYVYLVQHCKRKCKDLLVNTTKAITFLKFPFRVVPDKQFTSWAVGGGANAGGQGGGGRIRPAPAPPPARAQSRDLPRDRAVRHVERIQLANLRGADGQLLEPKSRVRGIHLFEQFRPWKADAGKGIHGFPDIGLGEQATRQRGKGENRLGHCLGLREQATR